MSFEGQQIGRYRLVRLLGRGGMGDVYLAEDARIEQHIAIKVIRAEASSYPTEKAGEEVVRLFQREARAIAKLDHPNILPLFDFGEEQIGDTIIMFLVMPYREQGSLASWLRQRTNGTLLTLQEVTHILQQAAAALQHAHNRQVIHQDVKPSNFLLRSREDDHGLPDTLLSDFGIAHFMTATSSASQSIRGTPSYMAPEQWEAEPTPATDQYALAVMAYELLSGRLPFQGGPGKMMYQHMHVQPQPPSSINPQLSNEIDAVLLRALAKEPQQRFATIVDFANAFQQAADGIQSVQEVSFTPNMASADKTVLPASTVGNDAEVYVKTIYASTSATSPLAAAQGVSSSAEMKPHLQDRAEASGSNTRTRPVFEGNIAALAPVKPSHMASRKAKRRPMLIVALIALMLAFAGGSIGYAASFFSRHGATTSFNRPRLADSAAVTIIPDSRALKSTYTVAAVIGTLSNSDHQVGARIISITTNSATQTANATGVATIAGTHASGTALVDNFNTASSLTLVAGSTYTNNYSSIQIHMVLDATVTVPPAPSTTVFSQRTVPGHILEIGTIGNNEFNNNIYGTLTWSVFNNPPFSNGKNSQNYTVVQQSDINNTANALVNANTPNAQQMIQPQIQANERLIGTPQCKPNITSNHQVGDKATSLTVMVSFTCTGEVYDYDGARALAATLLKTQGTTNPGSTYTLVGTIKTTVISTTLTDYSKGTVSLLISAEGIWVYQFSTAQQQQFAHLIEGDSKQVAIKALAQEPGVSKVTIQISGGDTMLLPTDPSRISIVIQRIR